VEGSKGEKEYAAVQVHVGARKHV